MAVKSLVLVLCMGFGSPLARAQSGPDERARDLYESGKEYYQAGKYTEALIAFETAYRLSGRNNLLRSIGYCYEKLNRLQEALATYHRWMTVADFEKLEEVNAAYDSGRCDVYTTDQSGLYGIRLTLASPADHVVLPEIISKEPLGPAVRQGDDQWAHIVRWTYFALLNAEEAGITQANVDEMKTSNDPNIQRLLGTEPDGKYGADLGLSNDWVVNIVKAVGNYGEIFERNVGAGSPLKIARGINALWTKGGLQYGMPVR